MNFAHREYSRLWSFKPAASKSPLKCQMCVGRKIWVIPVYFHIASLCRVYIYISSCIPCIFVSLYLCIFASRDSLFFPIVIYFPHHSKHFLLGWSLMCHRRHLLKLHSYCGFPSTSSAFESDFGNGICGSRGGSRGVLGTPVSGSENKYQKLDELGFS